MSLSFMLAVAGAGAGLAALALGCLDRAGALHAAPRRWLAIAALAAVSLAPPALVASLEAPARSQQQAGPTAAAGDDDEVARLKAYLRTAAVASEPAQAAMTPVPTTPSTPSVPDVNTMIARLASRLETAPDDVDGWRMLGWSYRNTGRPQDAVKAYERAVALAPQRTDLAQALTEARALVAGGRDAATAPAAAAPQAAAKE